MYAKHRDSSIHHNRTADFCQLAASKDIFDYIEVFYNRTRRHSHLGGVSPEAFEQASS